MIMGIMMKYSDWIDDGKEVKEDTRKRVCLVKVTNNDDTSQDLSCLMGPWYYVIKNVLKRYDIKVSYYGISGRDFGATHDIGDIVNADLVIWFTDREYRFHNDTMSPAIEEKVLGRLAEINGVIDGKEIIILSNEPADTLELFRDVVFAGRKPKLHYILESDFVPSIQTLRYYFIKEHLESVNRFLDDGERKYDFCYYGTAKSKNNDGTKSTDERALILRQIRKELGRKRSLYMGSIISNSDRGYRNDSTELMLDLTSANATLCFVWPGREKYVTARYQEALACGMVPLLWKDFDSENTACGDAWLRCRSVGDVLSKVEALRDDEFRKRMVSKLTVDFESKVLPKEHFINECDRMVGKYLI